LIIIKSKLNLSKKNKKLKKKDKAKDKEKGKEKDKDKGKDKEKDKGKGKDKVKAKERDKKESPKAKNLSAHSSQDETESTYSPSQNGIENHSQHLNGIENGKDDDKPDELLVSEFRVSPETVKILTERGMGKLFPIQALTFDPIYDGKDLIGRAQTGTGKTLSFALPIVERLAQQTKGNKPYGRTPVVLVLLPTRELAKQVANEFQLLSPSLFTLCVYGGAPYGPQEGGLARGTDVVVGTPGRLVDLLNKGTLKLENIQFVVLDEADEMLKEGFQDAIEFILSSIKTQHQTLLFSATIPNWVETASSKYMRTEEIEMIDLVGGKDRIQTSNLVTHISICCQKQRTKTGHFLPSSSLLGDVIKLYAGSGRTIVFASTKAEANELGLSSSIQKDCQVLHGDIAQSQREITLSGFREGTFSILVATDVAARGLDIPEVDLVIQCEPPRDVEAYIHRSGRTGRAGRQGSCVLFFSSSQAWLIRNIEKNAGIKFQRMGTPQPEDVVRSASLKAAEKLANVNGEILPYFIDAAKKVIHDSCNAETAMAQALALISGYTTLSKRSLLSAADNHTTILIEGGFPIRSPRFVITLITERLVPLLQQAGKASNGLESQIKEIRLCKDGGAVADLPSELATLLVENLKDRQGPHNFRFKLISELPLLEEKPDFGRGGFGFGGRGRGYRGRAGSGPGSRGSGRFGNQRGFSRRV